MAGDVLAPAKISAAETAPIPADAGGRQQAQFRAPGGKWTVAWIVPEPIFPAAFLKASLDAILPAGPRLLEVARSTSLIDPKAKTSSFTLGKSATLLLRRHHLRNLGRRSS